MLNSMLVDWHGTIAVYLDKDSIIISEMLDSDVENAIHLSIDEAKATIGFLQRAVKEIEGK